MRRYFPWLIAVFISMLGAIQAVYGLQVAAVLLDDITQLLLALGVGLMAFIGALIIVRQDGNKVGWLMMAVALVTSMQILYDPLVLVTFIPAPPSTLTPGLWLALWLHNWLGQLQIIIIFLIVLHFPDGHPPSKRWNWLNFVALGTILLAGVIPMLRDEIGPISGVWEVVNPIGLFPTSVYQFGSLIAWIGVFVLAGGSLASLAYRFRRGETIEIAQIKWLLFSVAGVIAVLGIFILYVAFNQNPAALPPWLNVLFQFAFLLIPLAIGNAILRYRLYDIDIIIRQTLQYSLLTGMLVLLYFLGVVTLQAILSPLAGETDSPLIIVVTTLGIAALFNPLRIRVQDFIDRRFYRAKFDAAQTLVDFAAKARDEVDIERLAGTLLGVVEETMQPDHLSLWLKDESGT